MLVPKERGIPPLLVLAGGASTRMSRITENKLSLPIRSRPLIAYLLAAAHGSSVRGVHIATTRQTHREIGQIAHEWRDRFETIECHIQPPLGTFRALVELWRTCGSPPTHFVSAGDLVCQSKHLDILMRSWAVRPSGQIAIFAIAQRYNAGHTGVVADGNRILRLGKSISWSEYCWSGLRIQTDMYTRTGLRLGNPMRDTDVATAIVESVPGALGACVMEGLIDVNEESDVPVAEFMAQEYRT